jgi:hypothetical protein
MVYETESRNYPVPEYDDTRWDVQIQNSMAMLDDDVATALSQSGGGGFSGEYSDLSGVPSTFVPKDHGDSAHNVNYAEMGELFSGSHNDLSGVDTDDHHTKTPEYTDSQAVSAVNGTDITPSSVDTGSVTTTELSVDSLMHITPNSMAPSSPSQDTVYLDDGTNTSDGTFGFRYYDGSAWVDL